MPSTGAGLSHVIERLAAGDASCLVVSGLERLSRSVAELGTIVQWLEENDVRLVAVELDLDTASPGGHATAKALASVGGWERERLADRTRKGLAAARAKRRAASGAGAPDWEAIRMRIAAMRADGMTLQAIADVLNEERVPTQRGGAEWRPSSVQTAAGYKRPASGSKRIRDLPRAKRRGSKDPPSRTGRRLASGGPFSAFSTPFTRNRPYVSDPRVRVACGRSGGPTHSGGAVLEPRFRSTRPLRPAVDAAERGVGRAPSSVFR